MIVLRDYQRQACDSAEPLLRQRKTTLVVMPTGTGKTSVLGELTRRFLDAGRILIIAHTEELIDQLAERVRLMCPDIEVGIEMGDRTCIGDRTALWGQARVVVGSRQSLIKRMHGYRPDEFALLIVDEAHHTAAQSYLDIIGHFPKSSLLGVTATPDRGDEQSLGKIFEHVAYSYTIDDALADGWLVPVRQQFLEVEGLDFSKARTKNGEFSDDKLDRILAAEPRVAHEIAAAAHASCPGQTLVFVPGVETAKLVAEIVNRYPDDSAEVVVGETHKQRRREIIAAYKRGDVKRLVGCAVFLEGFDAPETRHLLNGRPFRKRATYAQFAGRVMRPLSGILEGINTREERLAAIANSAKPYGHIIDLTTSSSEHELVFSGDILGGKEYSPAARKAAIKKAKAAGGPVDLQKLMEQEEQRIRQVAEERERRKHVRAEARVKYHDVRSEEAQSSSSGSRRRGPTEAMRNFLAARGYDADGMTFEQAGQLIGNIKKSFKTGEASPRQKEILERSGLPVDVPKIVASVWIDLLAARGWQPFDYTPTREMWTIKQVDGGFKAAIKDPQVGDVILRRDKPAFRTAQECRAFFSDVFNHQPSVA